QDVENSVQGFSRICGRTSGSRFWFGKKRFNHSPLFVCQLMSRTHTSIFHFTLADHVFEIACKDAYTLQPLPPFPLSGDIRIHPIAAAAMALYAFLSTCQDPNAFLAFSMSCTAIMPPYKEQSCYMRKPHRDASQFLQ